jgi:hypothetical protein
MIRALIIAAGVLSCAPALACPGGYWLFKNKYGDKCMSLDTLASPVENGMTSAASPKPVVKHPPGVTYYRPSKYPPVGRP